MTFHVEEKILWFDVSMSNALTMQVFHAAEDLLETAFDFGWRHSTLSDGRIKVTSWTELHDCTPMLILILHKIDGLDNVDVV